MFRETFWFCVYDIAYFVAKCFKHINIQSVCLFYEQGNPMKSTIDRGNAPHWSRFLRLNVKVSGKLHSKCIDVCNYACVNLGG